MLPAAARQAGADRALTELYRAHYRTLVRLAVLLIGDVRTAEHVAQDSFAAMHRAWRRLRDPEAALPFLHCAVITRSRPLAPEPALAVAPRYDPVTPAPLDRTPPAVLPALLTLPRPQREAVALHLYLELPEDQIAAAMRVTRDAARGHIRAGLAALRDLT